jgi:hypothetical protein
MPNDIYLSSTLSDLGAERDAAREVLGRQGYGVKESYTADEQAVLASCRTDVSKCEIYVCIVGMRYGFRPEKAENPDDESITQLEFRHAKRLNIPCYVFVKSDVADYKLAHTDSHTQENGAGERIKTFRTWVAGEAGVRPAVFSTLQELREKLLTAVLTYQGRGASPDPLLRETRRHPAELTTDVGLIVSPRAPDEAVSGPYRQHLQAQEKDRRFKLIELAPEDPQFLAKLDAQARDCRSLCWLLTPAVCQSYLAQGDLLQRTVDLQGRRRGGVAALLAGGVTPAALPSPWGFALVPEADASVPASANLDELYFAVRARVPAIKPDRRIGLPCLVFSMTEAEAAELGADLAPLMEAGPEADELRLRQQQLVRMRAAIRQPTQQRHWPAKAYGEAREDWRPFGPAEPTAREYLERAMKRLNDSEPNKRERLFIRNTGGDALHLQLMPYSLDELIDDLRGSRANVLSVRDRGCVVLVDEMALLHPKLRPWAKMLLKGENVALLSSHPADPAPYAVREVLAQDSSLQIGSLMTRFRDEQDPRCELAISSPERLQRWLRMVLPELVPVLAGEEVQSALLSRPEEDLFGKKVPT